MGFLEKGDARLSSFQAEIVEATAEFMPAGEQIIVRVHTFTTMRAVGISLNFSTAAETAASTLDLVGAGATMVDTKILLVTVTDSSVVVCQKGRLAAIGKWRHIITAPREFVSVTKFKKGLANIYLDFIVEGNKFSIWRSRVGGKRVPFSTSTPSTTPSLIPLRSNPISLLHHIRRLRNWTSISGGYPATLRGRRSPRSIGDQRWKRRPRQKSSLFETSAIEVKTLRRVRLRCRS